MGHLRKELFEELADFETSKKLSPADKWNLLEKRDALFRLAMKRAVQYAVKNYKDGDDPEKRTVTIPLEIKLNHADFHGGSGAVPGGASPSQYDAGAEEELSTLSIDWPCI